MHALIAVGVAGLLVGCTGSSGGGSDETTGTSVDAAGSTAGTDTAAGDDQPAGPDGALAGTGLGPGEFVLPDPAVGLEALSGYRATLAVAFEGTEAGAPLQWSTESVVLRSAEPANAQLTIEHSGDIDAPVPAYTGDVDGTVYERDADGTCTARAPDLDPSLIALLEPVHGVAGVMGAEPVGEKAIGGIDAAGYKFDERAVGLEGVAAAEGEVWVAIDGGYVLAYTMTSEGGDAYFGDGVDGTITWDYELADVNQPPVIEVPDDCPPGLVAAPLPPDTSNVIDVPGLLRYETSATADDILSFYQAAAADLGWTPIGEALANQTGRAVEFSDGRHGITILIRAGEAGTTVHALIGELPAEPSGPGATGAGTGGEANFELRGGHVASGTWAFTPDFSMLAGGMLTFHDPANPMPNGPFLTLVLSPGTENLSFSDGSITILAESDVCTFTIDRQDASGVSGTVECVGAQPGGVDISITFDVTA